ncbi:MAG: S41 family peptidase [bacterium]
MKDKSLSYYGLPLLMVAGFCLAFWFGMQYGEKKDPTNGLVINNAALATVASSTEIDMAPFWEAWKVLDQKFVTSAKSKKPTIDERVWGAIQGMTSAYNDPYTVFMPPVKSKSFNEDISGDFEGVGMEIGLKDGILTVIAPLKGTPAFRADIRPGDKILEINGTSTQNMTSEDAVKIIRGPKGSEVKVKILREGLSTPIEKTLVRDTINIPTIDTEIKGDVFVIRVYNFYAKSADFFRDALREFSESGKDRLIIDLRGNPGGYLEAAVHMTSWFLPMGKVIVREAGADGKDEKIHRSLGFNIFNDKLKLVILVDGGSASASEIMAGALRDQGLAKLVGTKTYGKGSVQELISMPEDSSLKVTIARWLTPNGYSISEQGLKPDYEVKLTEEDIVKKNDKQLAKAIEVLDQMK